MASVRPLSYNVPGADLPNGPAASNQLVATANVVRPRIGGSRSSRRKTPRGGFYPAVMGPLARSGPYLIAPALGSAYRLFNKKKKTRRHKRRTVRR